MKIGDRVFKKSKKPFKSGKIINTVGGFGINPRSKSHDTRCAFFLEDDSCVDLFRLRVV